jgi:hypothetical protein
VKSFFLDFFLVVFTWTLDYHVVASNQARNGFQTYVELDYHVIARDPASHCHHGEIHGEGAGQESRARDKHARTQQQKPQHQPGDVGRNMVVDSPGKKQDKQ